MVEELEVSMRVASISREGELNWVMVAHQSRSSEALQVGKTDKQLDEIKAIVDAVAGDCLVIATLFGPFASGNHASHHMVTEHLKVNPESVHQGLGAIAESLAAFALACVDAGASGIYFSAQGGEAYRFTEEQFLRYIKPHDLTILDSINDHGEFHLLHVCKDRIRLPLQVPVLSELFRSDYRRGR